MFEQASVAAKPRCPRRVTRLMWAAAAFAVVAFGFGGGVAQTLDGSTSISATPEDPCLMNHDCGEENQVPGVEAPGEQLQVHCEEMRQQGILTPECESIDNS